MTEKPILFSGPMVRAILEGRKTQTRRVVKPQPRNRLIRGSDGNIYDADCISPGIKVREPYGKPGDRLWVRETWTECQMCGTVNHVATINQPRNCKACDAYIFSPDRPSIHMARSVSRITLEVTGVRVERLQDMGEVDAVAEGCIMDTDGMPKEIPHPGGVGMIGWDSAGEWFQDLWNSINAHRGFGWDVNPWVWVIEFRKL